MGLVFNHANRKTTLKQRATDLGEECGDDHKCRWKSLIGTTHHHIIKEMCQEAAEHHRLLSSTLYMAKPNTANTVAPTLALSQKVEFLRSAWLTCLRNRKRRHTEGDKLSQSGSDWVHPNEWVWNVKIPFQMDDVTSIQRKQRGKNDKSETKTETELW